MTNKFLITGVFVLLAFIAKSQHLTQTVKGNITDKVSNSPIAGAIVVVVGSDPVIGTATDVDGNFKLLNVPVGKHTISVTFMGYKEEVLANVVVNSGKEVVLQIPLEEDLKMLDTVEVTAQKGQREAINNMSTVSTRTFSVEETQKFAAAVNDPGRMASSYAGVISTGDFNNTISIRGNSPNGLLWRMEGVDVPNPNHFAAPASSGGGISIISSQLLSNSDFSTGAFAAEYGNALSGVFDLKLRKGNTEKREYTFQAGFLGLDAAAEGPFRKGYNGSYLINYRLSTLSILQMVGLSIGDYVTNFQDLSYNFYLPTDKAGSFSVFGFTGLSTQTLDAKEDSTLWDDSDDARYNETYHSNTIANGIKHVMPLGDNTYLQSSAVYSIVDMGFLSEELDYNYNPAFDYEESYRTSRMNLNTILNHKFNARHSIRSGVYFNHYDYNLKKRYLEEETGVIETPLDNSSQAKTLQAFTQWRYRISEPLTMNLGLHYLHLLDNNTTSVEPRAAMKYELNEKQSVSLGYGLHAQMQPLGIYSAQVQNADGSYTHPNENIGFNKAHHMVLAYDRSLTKHMYAKVETYYQHLFDIAVENDVTSPLSTLNNEGDYITDPLVNKGMGRNYGVELTLEQTMHNNMYFLLSGSLFNSEYKALDDVWRNTRFNTNYAFVLTGGKEWRVGKDEKNKTFGVNIRATFVGGMRTTPIDVPASLASGETELIESQAYTTRADNYFRPDVRFSLRRNFKSMTTTLSLDLQNASNTKNVYGTYFDAKTGTVKEYYNLSFLPVLAYRMEF